MSLPYPSMTFVPLDVLTAEEMNQIVANIEHLANGTTLFTSSSGQGLGTFTLNDDIQNYKKIEVEYRDNDNNLGLTSFKVISGQNKALLTTFQPGGGSDTAYYIKSAILRITRTDANMYACKEGYIPNGANPTVGQDSSTILKVYSIVGY